MKKRKSLKRVKGINPKLEPEGTADSRQRKLERVKQREKRIFLGKRLAEGILTGLVLVFLLWAGWRGIWFFKKSLFLPRGRWVVGFESNPFLVVSFAPGEKAATVLIIPGKTLIKSNYGYGYYRAESFERLGQLEGREGLLKESLSTNLALPIEGWVGGAGSLPEEEEKLGSWLRDQFWQGLREKKTDLSSFDLWRLWWYSWQVKKSAFEVITLKEGSCLNRDDYPDGSWFYRLDLSCLDSLLGHHFTEEEFEKERKTVGVVNATDYPGLAREASRVVSNLGGLVLKIDDWEERDFFCRLRIGEEEKPGFTVKKLARVFNCEVEEGELGSFAVDVLLILGDDYRRRVE